MRVKRLERPVRAGRRVQRAGRGSVVEDEEKALRKTRGQDPRKGRKLGADFKLLLCEEGNAPRPNRFGNPPGLWGGRPGLVALPLGCQAHPPFQQLCTIEEKRP